MRYLRLFPLILLGACDLFLGTKITAPPPTCSAPRPVAVTSEADSSIVGSVLIMYCPPEAK